MPIGKTGVYTRFFEYANFRLHLSTFLVNVLRHFRINLSQLSVIAEAKVSHFEILCRVHNIEATVGLFRCFYVNSKNKGWMSFSKRFDSDALGFVSSSAAPGEIAAVYSCLPRPVYLGSGQIRINEMYANEERELLVELKVPSSAVGAHTVLSVRCSYKESVTQEVINCKDHALVVPKVTAVRSSHTIQRLRNLFVTTRALAESRKLVARNDLIGSYHMLISARALLHQTSSASSEFVVSIEAELSDLQRRRQAQAQNVNAAYVDEKGEPLTPTSAWRVAEKLAKVAIMRKSLNRVSDLHGFEDARF
nr:hypothetical protein [Tanacetum cinerariifolium]